jgi:hypothetical protein
VTDIKRQTIKRYVTFRDKLEWKIQEFKAAWNDDSYSENMGTVIDPLIDILILLAGYIPPELRQKITLRNAFRALHVTIVIGAALWWLWLAVGGSHSAWELSHKLEATGLLLLKMIAVFALAYTSSDIRKWFINK